MHAPEIDYSTANAPRNVKFGRQGFVHNLELFTADNFSGSPIISKNITQHNLKEFKGYERFKSNCQGQFLGINSVPLVRYKIWKMTNWQRLINDEIW